jgi:hypothetical protein
MEAIVRPTGPRSKTRKGKGGSAEPKPRDPEKDAAIAAFVVAYEAWKRTKLNVWREKGHLFEQADREGVLEICAAIERRSPRTLRRHALAASRMGDEEWEQILDWRDARHHPLRDSHLLLLSELPLAKREECRRRMRGRLWSISELRAWVGGQKETRGRRIH